MSNSKRVWKIAIASATIALLLPMLAPAESDAECPGCDYGPGAAKHHGRHGAEPGHFIDRHGEELGLDSEAREAIQAIVDDSRRRFEQIRDEIRDERKALHALMSQASPDESAVMAQHDRVEALKSKQKKNRLQAMLEIRKLLTPDQREQLVRIRESRRGDRECGDDAGGRKHDACGKCGKGWRASMRACRDDVASLCSAAEAGKERLQCLDANWEELSEDCRAVFENRGRRGPGAGRCSDSDAEPPTDGS